MSAEIESQLYGKSKVHVMKVKRDTSKHEVKELIVQLLLEGDFNTAYTHEDNSNVIPTDTIKNTIYALARKHPLEDIESFALFISKHFLSYKQVKIVNIEIDEPLWNRCQVDGRLHNHAFYANKSFTRFTKLVATHSSAELKSGFRDFKILKTTRSGFDGYFKDRYTLLRPTNERLLHTSFTAEWTFVGKNSFKILKNSGKYNQIFDSIVEILIKKFAGDAERGVYSPSVQATIYDMANGVITKIPEIETVKISMPNIHCILYEDLNKMGLDNPDEIYVVTNQPYGNISATVKRTRKSKL